MTKPQKIFFDLGDSRDMSAFQLDMLLYNLKSHSLPLVNNVKSLS